MPNLKLNRRQFIGITTMAAGATLLPEGNIFAQSNRKYTRYNVTSPGGQKALQSYAKGVEAMLKLPAEHPHNWFRNAFVHLFDCPHGNWWFYVWHRAYLGYFEQTIRQFSGDPDFALPYWDWTTLPLIPDSLFTGALTPNSPAFDPYIGNLAKFSTFIQPALQKYWASLNPDQLAQLRLRGYTSFDLLWNDVTGFSPKLNHGLTDNVAFANTSGSRFLSRDNPRLDEKTTYDVSPFVIYAGLLPADFNSSIGTLSFTSAKTDSHNAQPPNDPSKFSTLEGLAHNKVHNCIGGVGPLNPGPYGFMTNFLSAADPIFYLHHANMDRLWDVWTRKQQRLNLPWQPVGTALTAFSNDPFLFFVDGQGQYVLNGKAGDYMDMAQFGYTYETGFGEDVVQPPNPPVTDSPAIVPVAGSLTSNAASLFVPTALINRHLMAITGPVLMAEITLPRPDTNSPGREFDVIVGAPEGVTEVSANSPYYAGTIAFFGNMSGMEGMSMNATFTVPLPHARTAFAITLANTTTPLNIRVVPSHNHGGKPPTLKSVFIRAL